MLLSLILFTLIGFGFGFFWVWATKPLERRGWGHIQGLHLHHSMLGLLFLVLGFSSNRIQVVCFGIGMILHHLVTEGPQFITKD